jgi:hypothetical protein
MLIKFTKDLGKYQKGETHFCKSQKDKEKGTVLIDWGFAVETKIFPQEKKIKTEIKNKKKKANQKKLSTEIQKVREEKEKLESLVKESLNVLEEELKKKDQLIGENINRLETLKESSAKAEQLLFFKKELRKKEENQKKEGEIAKIVLEKELLVARKKNDELKSEVARERKSFLEKEGNLNSQKSSWKKEMSFLEEALSGREKELKAAIMAHSLAVSALQEDLAMLQKNNKKLSLKTKILEKEKQGMKEEVTRNLIFFEDQLNQKDKQIKALSLSLGKKSKIKK